MKPNDIHRSVKNLQQDRRVGDAPLIGKVSRMPGAGRIGEKPLRKRHSRGNSGSRTRKSRNLVVLTWSIVFVITTLGVIGSAVFLFMKGGKDHEATGKQAPKEVRVASRFPSPSETEALDLVKQALLARDPAAVKKYFRMDGTNSSAAVSLLEGLTRHDGPINGYQWIGSMDQNGLLIDAVNIRSQSAESLKNRVALLTPDDNGVWKIDFHAFARTCVPAWSEIVKESTKGARARVFFRRDSYYNSTFSDEKAWVCHQLWSPDGSEPLLGYCRAGSPQEVALDRILRRNASTGTKMLPAQACLEIRRVEGAEARQFEITSVLAEGWVMSATPFDELSQ